MAMVYTKFVQLGKHLLKNQIEFPKNLVYAPLQCLLQGTIILFNKELGRFTPKDNFNRLGFPRRCFNCSVQYSRPDYVHEAVSVAYPKPEEIQWRKELSNSVHLMGFVGVPVEIMQLPSGKVLSSTRLALKKSASETSWVRLRFWDELANIAFQHVQKGHQIYVSGRLVSSTFENNDGKQQTYCEVVVQQLNFVEKGLSSFSMHDHESNSMTEGRKLSNNAANGTETIQELWQAFFANPVDWWDSRKTKYSRPDYVHEAVSVAYPKPEEIQWRKELSNSVHLMGFVGVPVEIKQLPSGKVLSRTRLTLKKSASETSWVNLTFWDELANISFQHVQKGHQIYVSGRLVSNTFENNDGKQQTNYEVVVQQLNFVEKGLSSFSIHDHESNSMTAGRKLSNNAANGTETIQELWQQKQLSVYPKPEEIQWRKELSNSVHLMGCVGVPVEIKHLPSGKVLSTTCLVLKMSASETSWVRLTFWDELANISFQHVQKGHQIYVSGRLVSNTFENNDGKQKTNYEVVVQQLNFVEKGLSSFTMHDHESNSMTAGQKLSNNAANGTETIQELW